MPAQREMIFTTFAHREGHSHCLILYNFLNSDKWISCHSLKYDSLCSWLKRPMWTWGLFEKWQENKCFQNLFCRRELTTEDHMVNYIFNYLSTALNDFLYFHIQCSWLHLPKVFQRTKRFTIQHTSNFTGNMYYCARAAALFLWLCTFSRGLRSSASWVKTARMQISHLT